MKKKKEAKLKATGSRNMVKINKWILKQTNKQTNTVESYT